MLGWAIAFILAAITLAILGFTGDSTTMGAMAKVLFWIFVAGFVVSLVMYYSRTRA
jgi:uncharacterized membrane protein YtjA (UPF0391 family)